MPHGVLRVAAWQCVAGPLDPAGNLARLRAACERAAAADADVLVTPECFTTGYAISPADTLRLAEPADGPTAAAIAEITLDTGVAVAYGYPERGADGLVYNAAQLVDGGRTIARHRKLQRFGELDRERFAPGGERPGVALLRGRRVSMLICYDVEFPEAVRAAAMSGAEAILVPTANMTGYELVSEVLVRARALENGCSIVYANYCGTEGELTYAGLSTVCSPTGDVLALGGSAETLLIADLPPAGAEPSGYLADRRDDLW